MAIASLKDYKSGKVGITDFAASLKSNMPADAYFLFTRNEIVWESLKPLKIRGLKNTAESIAAACDEIVNIEPFLRSTGKDPIDVFMRAFLDLKILPVVAKVELETEAKKHLRAVELLLEHYKSLPIIQKNELEPEKPRNHMERTQLEFFRRTLVKKDQIVQYLTSGTVDTRAIEKSATLFKPYYSEKGLEVEKQILYSSDFPYTDFLINKNKVEFGMDMEMLDYRLINTIRNKYIWVKGSYGRSDGYSKAFNKALKKSINPKKFFNELLKDLESVPLIDNRRKIFKELKSLFFNKHWHGFFALALPQVEGIFNEMLELVNQKKSNGTLTDKVHILRPFYESSPFYFDYYEYFLPNWRNHFAHSGKLDDAEIKSYYLLLDLKDLLITSVGLNSPMSRIALMMKNGSGSLSHIGDLSELLALIKDLDKLKTLGQIQKNLDRFVYKELAIKIDLKDLFENLEHDFTLALSKFENHLEMAAQFSGLTSLKLFNLTPAQVITHIPQIEKAYDGHSWLMKEDLKLLLDTNNVLHDFEKYFPKLPISLLDTIHSFQKKFKPQLKTLSQLNALAKFELPDDYLLLKRSMRHVIK